MKITKELLDSETRISLFILIVVIIGMIISIVILAKVAKKTDETKEKIKIFCEQECTENNIINYQCSNQCYAWYTQGNNK